MILKRMSDDLRKFQQSDRLLLEDVLGTVQNISRDIRKETGQSVEHCSIQDPDRALNLLIWMGKLCTRIYDANAEALNPSLRLEELRVLEENLRQRVSASEGLLSQITALRDEVAQLEQRLDLSREARAECDRLTRRRQELRSQDTGDADQSRAAELRREIAALEAHQQEASQALQSAQTEYLRVKQACDQSVSQRDELLRQAAGLAREGEQARGEVQQLRQRAKALETEMADISREEAGLSSEIAALESRQRQLNASCQQTRCARDVFRSDVDDALEEQKKLEAECAALEQEKQRLEGENASLMSANSICRAAIRLLRESLSEHREKSGRLEDQREKLEGQCQELRNRMEALDQEVTRLEEQSLPHWQQRVDELEAEQGRLSKEIAGKQASAGDLEQQTAQLAQQCAALQQEIDGEYQVCQSLRDERSKMLGEKTGLEEQIRSLEHLNKELEQELKGKSEEGLTRILSRRRDALTLKKNACDQLERELSQADRALEQAEADLKSRQGEFARLDRTLKERYALLDRLEQRMQDLQAREKELQNRKNRYALLRSADEELRRHTEILYGLQGIAPMENRDSVQQLIRVVGEAMDDIDRSVRCYVELTNHKLEELQ